MASAEQLNSFLVDMFGRINKIEERVMAEGLGSAVSITEIHIIEKIGALEPIRMSEVARSIGVTLATLTDKGRAAYEYHRAFHDRMIASVMDTLSPEQAAILAQSLEKLQDFFQQEEAGMGGAANG